jgi:hypothetical protein
MYLLNCITRTEINVQTEMHKFINAFIDQKSTDKTGYVLFNRDGSLQQENPLTPQVGHGYV